MTEDGCYIKPNPKYMEAAAELLGLADSKAGATRLLPVIARIRSLRARS